MIERFADLILTLGANMEPGKPMILTAEPEQAETARAIADAAYRRGAKYVDVAYLDPWVRRSRLLYAEDPGWVPPWLDKRWEMLVAEGGARLALRGATGPEAGEGVDPARAGMDRLPLTPALLKAIAVDQSLDWCVVPAPTAAWAAACRPATDLEGLWAEIAHIMRLEADDPVAAWKERMAQLEAAAARITERRLDAVRFTGPGTDLTVGLLPTSRWSSAGAFVDGQLRSLSNIPSEEIYSTPDPARTEGVCRCTKPLALLSGVVVEDLTLRFEGGRLVEVTASEGEDAVRAMFATDDGASRLGEVALVDAEGRIGATGRVYMETLLDENAASHVALGNGYHSQVGEEDRSRVNSSDIHVDVMIGSPEVDVTGITAGGDEVPVLTAGAFA